MFAESLRKAATRLQDRIELTSAHGKITRGSIHDVCGVASNGTQSVNQYGFSFRVLLTRVDAAALQRAIAEIRIGEHNTIGHREERKREADTKKDP